VTTTSVEPPPGASLDGVAPAGAEAPPVRRLAGAVLVIIGLLLGAGVLAGVLWAVVAPTVPCTVDEFGDCWYSYEGGRFFIGEGLFALIAVCCGVIAAILARRWLRELGWPVVVALAVGGALASVVAWRVGVWLGPDEFDTATMASGETAEWPLRLRSAGLLLVWSTASLVVALVGTLLDDSDQAYPAVRSAPE
jgi:hypothetical protein